MPITENFPLAAIILAAGKGTRMRSSIPKVMHQIGGQPMLQHVLNTAKKAGAAQTVVVTGPDTPAVVDLAKPIPTTIQADRLGTGHAVQQAIPALDAAALKDQIVVVLYGDTPLIKPNTIQQLAGKLTEDPHTAIAVLGFKVDASEAYGRLAISGNGLTEIIEYADATPEQKQLPLGNAGIMVFNGAILPSLLAKLDNNNSKGEYYLTDTVSLALQQGYRCQVQEVEREEVIGVNTKAELAVAERILQQRLRQQHLANGVTMTAPETVFLSADTKIAADVVIEPNVVLGAGVRIDAGTTIKAFSHLEGVTVGEHCQVGPFARLRPGTVLHEYVRIGDFVETKNAVFEAGSKASHLSYLGDSTIGAGANIGAGTITCNYDGFNKHKTYIGAGAFIGSNSALVAPVSISDGALVAAGSVITQNVPANAIASSRAPQQAKDGAAERFRQRQVKRGG